MLMNEIVIEAGKTERHYWVDLWRYRELFFFLSWRDLLVRYKQTVIGLLWALLRPLLIIVIGTLVFSKLTGPSSDNLPYPVLICAATLPWQFFASAMAEASNSLIVNANMISKIYFPRLIIPASAVIVSFSDLLISLVILVGLMLWYHVMPTWRLMALPLFTLLAFAASFGVGLWLSALNVKFRDFRYIIPFIVQFGIFVSPVFFTTHQFFVAHDEWACRIYNLNPMVAVIDGYRWAIGDDASFNEIGLLTSLVVTPLLLFSGVKYFRATEKAFADII
jgi:lipopolysaccharide transport system permease protein